VLSGVEPEYTAPLSVVPGAVVFTLYVVQSGCLHAVVSAESSPPKPAFFAAARVRSAVWAAPGSNRSHAHPAAASTAVCARCAATAAAVAAPHSAAPLPALPPPVASHSAMPPAPAPPVQCEPWST
jgi:hypothetical protein